MSSTFPDDPTTSDPTEGMVLDHAKVLIPQLAEVLVDRLEYMDDDEVESVVLVIENLLHDTRRFSMCPVCGVLMGHNSRVPNRGPYDGQTVCGNCWEDIGGDANPCTECEGAHEVDTCRLCDGPAS